MSQHPSPSAVRGAILLSSQADVTALPPAVGPCHSLEALLALPVHVGSYSVFVACCRMLGHMALEGPLAAPALWWST